MDDITEQKCLEAQMIKLAKLASLEVIAEGVAHEIRNSLAISSAAAQLLSERPRDEKLREETVQKMYSGIQRTSYLLENLLKFLCPPEEGMAPVDINEALEETLSLFADYLRTQKIKLGKAFAPNLPPVIGNESLLLLAFSNILLKASSIMQPAGGSLTIITKLNSSNQVEIRFADTGRGIPKETLGEFFESSSIAKLDDEGTGLSLLTSRSIIKKHHGTMDVESKPGVGNTFTIRLPMLIDEREDAGV